MTISHPTSGAYTVSQQLPVQMNMTIGRAGEIASLAALLRREDVRLLTLTGPGGVGKTRLALEVAREVGAEFQDGVCFVSLAALREPELVLPTIAQALGIEELRKVLSFACQCAAITCTRAGADPPRRGEVAGFL